MKERVLVEVVQGNLLESKAQTLVNTVNCVGVMGKGIALQFKERFPDMYKDYVARCARGEVRLGEPYLYRHLIGPWVLNFPTKQHWRSVSRVSDIERGLEHLEEHYHEWGIESLAVPPLGCGNGQLEWQFVGPTLFRHLAQLDVPVVLYAPPDIPVEQLDTAFLQTGRDTQQRRSGAIEPAWIALVQILECIQREPYHPPIGRVALQKIAYFATQSGLPTGLHYQRGSYGPFSPELKRQLTRLANNGLISEEQIGNAFTVSTGPTYRDAAGAAGVQTENWQDIVERVADLFMRVRTTHQAEVAATVHFAASELRLALGGSPTEADVLDAVMDWKINRKPPLRDEEVAGAIRNLNMLGWLDVLVSEDLPLAEEELIVA